MTIAPEDYLATVNEIVGRFAGLIASLDGLPDALAHIVLTLARFPNDAGLVVTIATTPLAGTTVLEVSPWILAVLGYADLAEYQAALSSGDFVHEADLPVVEDHVRHQLTGAYDARLLRANGSYARLRIQGFTLRFKAVAEPMRWTIISRIM